MADKTKENSGSGVVITVHSVKAGGKLHPPGSSITVTPAEAARLIAFGAAKAPGKAEGKE